MRVLIFDMNYTKHAERVTCCKTNGMLNKHYTINFLKTSVKLYQSTATTQQCFHFALSHIPVQFIDFLPFENRSGDKTKRRTL